MNAEKTRKFKVELSDGTKCTSEFRDENDARDFYGIFYGMKVKRISEVKKENPK